MKIDLILENIRNQYTLGLLEESTVAGLDEKTVIKGKMLINESTMELRKMLIQEGVLADVRAVLAAGFARVIEEATWEDFTQGLKSAFTAPESQRSISDKMLHDAEIRHSGYDSGSKDGYDTGNAAGYKAGNAAGTDAGYNKGAGEYTDYLTQATQGAGKIYDDAMAQNASEVASMKAQHADAMAALQAKNDALQAQYDNSVSGQVNSAAGQVADKVNGVVDQAKTATQPYVDQATAAYNANVAPTVAKAGEAISGATAQVKDSYNANVAPTVAKAGEAINNGYQSTVGAINNGVAKAREAYDAASPYQVAGAGAAGAAALGAAGYGAYRMGQRRR